MLVDYHIHPDYSIDAEEHSIDMYCSRAVKLNINELCFTPHFECDPVRKEKDCYVRLNCHMHSMEDWRWLDFYFNEIENARVKYQPYGLNVKAGMEIGYDIGLESTIKEVVNTYPFDYILGSVHTLDHCAISNKEESGNYFQGKTPEKVMEQYYDVIYKMVETNLFDCIGHIDLYRRYGVKYLGSEMKQVNKELVEPILMKITEFNMGLEINTSSRRRGHNEFHPNFELLKLAVECGVEIFTIGSDAHRLSELGDGIKEAYELLNELGQNITVYDRRIPSVV
ncbi:MAG: histidinol-phosphatase [Firmicutes bacterium]|nr:histidinol-phosphatase [Bacillota bacterium]